MAALPAFSSIAAEPKAAALDAICTLYIVNDLAGFQEFLDVDMAAAIGFIPEFRLELERRAPIGED